MTDYKPCCALCGNTVPSWAVAVCRRCAVALGLAQEARRA